jgi:hypothetical protein
MLINHKLYARVRVEIYLVMGLCYPRIFHTAKPYNSFSSISLGVSGSDPHIAIRSGFGPESSLLPITLRVFLRFSSSLGWLLHP